MIGHDGEEDTVVFLDLCMQLHKMRSTRRQLSYRPNVAKTLQKQWNKSEQ